MIHPITVATRAKSIIGWTSVARPNNTLAVPMITSILILTVGSVTSLYKCTKDLVVDAKERIEYYNEIKSQ